MGRPRKLIKALEVLRIIIIILVIVKVHHQKYLTYEQGKEDYTLKNPEVRIYFSVWRFHNALLRNINEEPRQCIFSFMATEGTVDMRWARMR